MSSELGNGDRLQAALLSKEPRPMRLIPLTLSLVICSWALAWLLVESVLAMKP